MFKYWNKGTMYNATTETAKLRAKSKYAVRAKDEEKLDFGDDFSSFPVEQLKLLAALGEKHRLGFREVIGLGLSKLQTDLAEDVIERMRDMIVCAKSASKDFGGVHYVAAKGNFKSDRFMHRIATDTRSPPGWVAGGQGKYITKLCLISKMIHTTLHWETWPI